MLYGLMPVAVPLLVFSCMINLLVSTGPLFLFQVVDRVLPTGDTTTLLTLVLIAMIALTAMAILEYLRGIMMSRAAAWWERDTLRQLMPRALLDSVSAREVSNNVSRVSNFLAGSTLQAMVDAPWAVLFFIVAYLIHPLIALVGLMIALALIVMALAGHVLGRTSTQQAISTRAQASGVALHLDQNRKLLSTMGIATNLIGLQRRYLADSHGYQKRSAEADAARRAAARFLRTAMQVLVLGVGAWLVVAGELSGGAMIACSILLARALAPIEQLAGSLPAFIDFRLAFRELRRLVQDHGQKVTGFAHPALSQGISCENLTVATEPGALHLLHQVSFDLPKGTCVAVMGASGAGKSTLIELIAGAAVPSFGSVKLDGTDLRNWTEGQRAEAIGFLPQQPTLFPGTIAENIARFQPDADHNQILRAAVAAGAHALIARLPDGYQTRIAGDTGVLSGGERQRIAMARALFGSPQILILDEPNAALDREGERALIATLTHQKEMGVTIVMVAHRAGILGMVDRILLLDSGRVRDWGSRAEVIARMNARMKQIDLAREPAEATRLEDWINSHFKRDNDAEARSAAVMIAVELFNISLASPKPDDPPTPIRFTLRHTRGTCTITMLDTCEMIASTRIDKLRRIAEDDLILAPALEGPDLALLMVMQLSEALEQKQADHGRVIQASIATPIEDGSESDFGRVLN